MIREIKKCRICGNKNLISIVHLGDQYLTGLFPRDRTQKITSGPLELVKCEEDSKGNTCGLVQLRHSFDINEMYGENYGYRSSLNKSMVEHLHGKVKKILKIAKLENDDLIVDIGSNDSTLLQGYPKDQYTLVGIDPTGKKFYKYYPKHIQLIPDFFSAKVVQEKFGKKKAKIITSISMFYDLESPLDFMRDIYETLDDEGVWIFEQSYMPTMLEKNSYDTICHEHLEYYALKQIKWMTDHIGFKIVDIELNAINGGSFSLIVAKKNSSYKENTELIQKVLKEEEKKGLSTLKPFEEFKRNIYKHRDELIQFINDVQDRNETIVGYGASTKGNVILQFCNITEKEIPFIAEVNEDKFGCFTPGTLIPIISEEEVRISKPNYCLVLPWHFKDNIVKKEKSFLDKGGCLVMPLPEIEIIKKTK